MGNERKYAVWIVKDDEIHYHVRSIEEAKGGGQLPAGVPADAIMIDADTNGQALDLFIERGPGAIQEEPK